MVQPMLLVDTGHSYEAAHIRRWLDSHNTCPISRKQLASKQLVVNYNLKKAVASWAADHGISLPPAPMYQSLHECMVGANPPAEAAAAAAGRNAGLGSEEILPPSPFAGAAAGPAAAARLPSGVQQRSQQQQQGGLPSKDISGVVIDQMPSVGPAAAAPNDSGKSISNISFVGMDSKDRGTRRRCTRTRWALGLTAVLLVVAAGVAAGVGVAVNRKKGKAHETMEGPHHHLNDGVFLAVHLHRATTKSLPRCWLLVLVGHHQTNGEPHRMLLYTSALTRAQHPAATGALKQLRTRHPQRCGLCISLVQLGSSLGCWWGYILRFTTVSDRRLLSR
jgi:hypothetical protein